jgi:hypothetical protein
MKFVCLVYSEEAKLEATPDSHCLAFANGLRDAKLLVAAEALQPVRSARTVRVRQGRSTVVDGPFAETTEQLAGFYLIDARNFEEALEIAARIPPAAVGSVEVRPVRELVA